ncbi:MAG TPA: histidine phosphatase family protein [Myxococcales bacterium]|nr:histidine phosphatase family protein [Myxococcales bacterium]
MIRLYLVRHAVATEPGEGAPPDDALRALTARGRRRFRKNARAFAGLGEEVELICTSPVLRAVQTAELLAAAVGHDEVQVLEELRRSGGVGALLEKLSTLQVRSLALVGHRRLLKELAVVLSGIAVGQASRVRFKRGAIARIDVRKMSADSGAPRWWLAPSGKPLRDGLPLHDDSPG